MEVEKKKRGFAAISPERRKEIASMGGKKAHALGKAHKFTSQEAAEAGRKGGLSTHSKKKEGTAEAAIFSTATSTEGRV